MAVSYNASQVGTSKQIRWSWSSDSAVIAWAVAIDGTMVDHGTNSSGAAGTESVSSWGRYTVTFNIGGTTYTKTVDVDEPPTPPTPTTGPYIFNGTSWVQATPYIFNGTSWVQATANIFDGSSWQS